jgi:hypothetical protein
MISACVWFLVGSTVIALPLKVLNDGYLPSDDALRHAAKAVCGKPWSEILVLRPEITIDHNAGWHSVLSSVHWITGWDASALVRFSVITMFVFAAATPLIWTRRRPEMWLASLALVTVLFPYFVTDRLFLGRPLFVTMAVNLMLLCIWTQKSPASFPVRMVLSVGLVALAAWIHGSWYLLALVSAAFFLSGRVREALAITACWLFGSILGASLTGNPWAFLTQSVMIPVWALGQNAPAEALVGEFLPLREGYWPAFLLGGAILFWRTYRGQSLRVIWRDPVFILAVLGLVLGFRVIRFWLDWGIPALALWTARQFELLMPMERNSPARLAVAFAASAALFLSVATDRNGRWSDPLKIECLDARRPEHADWVPGPGGILYNVDLPVFYQTFFTNPNGNWRYIMGFEATFMRPEDLAVYHEICKTGNAIRACAPWVSRMRPEDRLVLRGPPGRAPSIPQLEWFYAADQLWVGRVRK